MCMILNPSLKWKLKRLICKGFSSFKISSTKKHQNKDNSDFYIKACRRLQAARILISLPENIFKCSRVWKWSRPFLPLLALIICSTISAAPRACSLACWYRIFCFSISFSWRWNTNTQLTKRYKNSLRAAAPSSWIKVPQMSFPALLLPLPPHPLHSSDKKNGHHLKSLINLGQKGYVETF